MVNTYINTDLEAKMVNTLGIYLKVFYVIPILYTAKSEIVTVSGFQQYQ